MADNVVITAGSGTTIHADEYTHTTLGAGKTQLVKLVDGVLNSDTPITVDIGAKANALRVVPANDITDATYIGDIKFGEAEPNSAAILADTTAIVTDLAAIEVLLGTMDTDTGAMVTDLAAIEALLITMDTDTGAMVTDLAALEVDLAAIEVLQTTIAGDTTSIDGKITACNTGAVVISSGTVTTVSTVTNLAQMGGTALSMDEGTVDAGCQRVTLATDDDGVAHLATIAGDTTNIETAVQLIDNSIVSHDAAVSAAGIQLMAAYDSTKPTAVDSDADAVRVLADAYGRLLSGVEPEWFNAIYDSADATAEGKVIKAKTAGKKMYILSCILSSDVEGWMKLQDEDSNALTGKMWFKAGGGTMATWPPQAPLVLDVANKDLEVIVEAAGNISVTITGYLAP